MALSEKDLADIHAILHREPTVVERHIVDTMWSEHCSYKSSKPVLKQLPTQAQSVALGIGEDAGIVRFHSHNGQSYCIAMSHESHNHPSQILPIEGAATGVGGCVRDVYCMGADVIGVLNSLHFGIANEQTTANVDDIAKKVVQGVADYGNPLGVPVLGGETLYHASYNDNCLVNVAALGLIKEDDIIHSYVPKQALTEPYDILLIGKSTDATGFGGASFSSVILDEDNQEANMGAIQLHDPFLKRVVVEAIKTAIQFLKQEQAPIGFKDLGAGGISCAASEIAVGGGFGVHLHLNKVPCSSPDLLPEVIACSETQERFCMALPRQLSAAVCAIFNETFALPTLYPKAGATVIGEVTHTPDFVMTFNEETVCHLPVQAITTEVHATRIAVPRPIQKTGTGYVQLAHQVSLQALCEQYIGQQLNASKRYVYRYFDNAVRGDTVVYPGEADAVVISPIPESAVGLAVTMDSNLYGAADPYVAGAGAVAESIRNLISVGATPLALTDCLNYGNPEKGPVFFDFEQGVLGIKEAAIALSFHEKDPIPIISGNVSFYNESTQGQAVVPSPVVCAIGKIDDAKRAKTAQCFTPNCDIVLVGKRYAEFSGTQLEPHLSKYDTVAPQVRFEDEKKQNALILKLYDQHLIESCHDISSGGFWVTLIEMLLGERGQPFVGATLDITACESTLTHLFSENGGFVFSTHDLSACTTLLDQSDVWYMACGVTREDKALSLITKETTYSFDLKTLSAEWNRFNP